MDYLCEYAAYDDIIDIKPQTNIDDNTDTLSLLLLSAIKQQSDSDNETSNVNRRTALINIEHNYSSDRVKFEKDCDSDVDLGLDDYVSNGNNEVVERLITPEEVFRDLLVTEDIRYKDEQIKQQTGNVTISIICTVV